VRWGSATRDVRQSPDAVAASRLPEAARWRAAFDALPEACFLVNTAGQVEVANRAAQVRAGAALPAPFASLQVWLGAATGGEERVWRAPLSDAAGAVCGEIVRVQSPPSAVPRAGLPSAVLTHLGHELKSPLHTIRAYSEVLREGGVDAATRNEFFAVIGAETQRLANLIDTLVDLSKIDSGDLVPQRGALRVDAVLAAEVRAAAAAACSKSIDLAAGLPATLPAVLGDADLLAVALRNLLSNAIQYTPCGGRVDVRANATDETLTVEIADTGIGIHPDDRPQVFQRFFRGRAPEVRKHPGSGLGLALVERIVALHGGTLAVESELGRGSTFRLSLPAAGSAAPESFPAREVH
jgi:two-component system sensor histidine kinase VicK